MESAGGHELLLVFGEDAGDDFTFFRFPGYDTVFALGIDQLLSGVCKGVEGEVAFAVLGSPARGSGNRCH